MRILMTTLLALTLLVSACGDGDEQPRSRQAFERAMAEIDPVLKIAALQTWLSDYPQANEDDRASVLREVWSIHESRHEVTAGLAWARVELESEPSEKGRGVLYSLLFANAVERDSRDAAIQLGEELWESGLTDPSTLNQIGWGLVGDPGWSVELGARLAERGVEFAKPGRDRASIMDTAGWGYFLLGRKEPSRRLLEGALAELPEPDREVAGHLASLYERIGEEDLLLQLWTRILDRRMDSQLQARAESVLVKQGRNIGQYRENIWKVRLGNAKEAPDFELTDLEGRKHRLSDNEGKVVMLNFWHPT